MKKPFEVGDRVAIYDGNRFVGTIDEIEYFSDLPTEIQRIWVNFGSYGQWFHSKQCRRLVKKKRREIWVNYYEYAEPRYHSSKEAADYSPAGSISTRRECVRFVEAKEKS